MDLDRLDTWLAGKSVPAYRGKQVRAELLSGRASGWDDVTTLPKQMRGELASQLPFSTVSTDLAEHSDDGSVKLRMTTADNFPLEAVLMRFEASRNAAKGKAEARHTVCLSSQSGCALACTFCATGSMGLGRNLTRWEIVDQFLELARIQRARGGTIDNVVMMGMGEPFHNYDEVLAAIRILNAEDGCGLAARRIAISTAGWIPGIDALAKEPMQVKLALSLHAPNDELRTQLMPVTKKFPIRDLMAALRRYRAATKRRVFIEYLMLEGVNDQPEHARELGQLLRGGEGFHVNLIAYNPTGSEYIGSSDDMVRQFAGILEAAGVRTSYRVSRGRDISAACGQLAAPLAQAKAEARAKRQAILAAR